MSDYYNVELVPQGVQLDIPVWRTGLNQTLTSAEARELACSLVAAADAWDDDYGAGAA